MSIQIKIGLFYGQLQGLGETDTAMPIGKGHMGAAGRLNRSFCRFIG
jgi:hypothetical protein